MPYASTEAYRELLDLLRDADQLFLGGDRAVGSETDVADGYTWLLSLLQVATIVYVHGDADRPTMVPIEAPHMKWGGDNSDAFYHYAAIHPDRTYRLRGVAGDAKYLSVTVYGGPDDGRWSNRIVATLNDRSLHIEPDGSFEITLSRHQHRGNWMKLDDDAVALVTRDYLAFPDREQQATWSITCDHDATPPRPTDAQTARGLRAATNFLRELLGIMPLPLSVYPSNEFQEPYPQPAVTYGWAAGDAAYAMGRFTLADDEALVIEGTFPNCAFWNLCLWNPYLVTYDFRYERVTINGFQAQPRDDGSFELVIAHRDPGHPNWISTAGRHDGLLWFRWFLAESVPDKPRTKVIRLNADC